MSQRIDTTFRSCITFTSRFTHQITCRADIYNSAVWVGRGLLFTMDGKQPGSEGYAASKGGIYSLTHALALSLSEWNITVNSIAPGWIQTHDYNQLQPEDHSQHPSRRVGKPEDIARMCLFLCEENNDFINGENITIDGGMTKKMIYISSDAT